MELKTMNYAAFEQLCKEKKITPTAVARKLGLKKGNTTNWKKGGNPSAEILKQLAVELNCTSDYLLGLDDTPCRPPEAPPLTGDEQRLLDMYRLLTDMEKGEILGELKATVQNKKKNTTESA